MIRPSHPYYLVAQVDWEDRPRILASGTLQEMQKAWKDCNGETTIGGFHAWVYVYSEEELENA